jgi:hypothetical protein
MDLLAYIKMGNEALDCCSLCPTTFLIGVRGISSYVPGGIDGSPLLVKATLARG